MLSQQERYIYKFSQATRLLWETTATVFLLPNKFITANLPQISDDLFTHLRNSRVPLRSRDRNMLEVK